jgi:hypothetical protein
MAIFRFKAATVKFIGKGNLLVAFFVIIKLLTLQKPA